MTKLNLILVGVSILKYGEWKRAVANKLKKKGCGNRRLEYTIKIIS